MAGQRARPASSTPPPREPEAGRSGAPRRASTDRADAEPRAVIRELDALSRELVSRRPARSESDGEVVSEWEELSGDAPSVEPDIVPEPEAEEELASAPSAALEPLEDAPDEEVETDPTDDSAPSLYLEERLRRAGAALDGLGQDVQELDLRWKNIRETTETLQRELTRAQREIEFVRGAEPADALEAPAPLPAGPIVRVAPTLSRTDPPPEHRVWSTGRVAPPSRRLHGQPLPGPFGEFTAARYNRTIADLKSRRLKLAGYTMAFAALISAALLIVTWWAHDPMPPLWIAVLPAFWMIPVPFFVLSFRGTHRVLRRNHLEIAAE